MADTTAGTDRRSAGSPGRRFGALRLLALIFTLMLVVITLSGSLWVMYHLNNNMMPATMHDMKNMP